LQEGDELFLRQVLNEARAEKDGIVSAARQELQTANDEAEFRSVVPLLRTGVEVLNEDLLVEGLSRAAALDLSAHRNPAVREVLEGASLCLGRIRNCKTLLEAALRSVKVAELSEAVTVASGASAHL
jgi:hypothetical protein